VALWSVRLCVLIGYGKEFRWFSRFYIVTTSIWEVVTISRTNLNSDFGEMIHSTNNLDSDSDSKYSIQYCIYRPILPRPVESVLQYWVQKSEASSSQKLLRNEGIRRRDISILDLSNTLGKCTGVYVNTQ
jgi:hypothetical protein